MFTDALSRINTALISRINMDTITKRISDDLWVLNVMEVTVNYHNYFSSTEFP